MPVAEKLPAIIHDISWKFMWDSKKTMKIVHINPMPPIEFLVVWTNICHIARSKSGVVFLLPETIRCAFHIDTQNDGWALEDVSHRLQIWLLWVSMLNCWEVTILFCWKDIRLIIDSPSNTKIDIFIENQETIGCWVFHFLTSTTSKRGGLEDLFPFQMGDFSF